MNSILGLLKSSLFKNSKTLLPPIFEETTKLVETDNLSSFSFKLIETDCGNCSHR